MKEFLKKILPIRVSSRLKYWQGVSRLAEAKRRSFYHIKRAAHPGKLNVLFFNIGGMSFSGTEKFLQILARHLDKEKFNKYFLYSSQKATGREDYVKEGGVELIDFTYTSREPEPPYVLHGSNPKLRDVMVGKQIDVVVTAGAGLPEHPLASISGTPIVDINIFGSINPQTDIQHYICISDTLTRMVSAALPGRRVSTMYIQSEGPDKEASRRGQEIRNKLGFRENDFVFGRIGRPDDAIFDPIAITAFSRLVKNQPRAHYLVMSSPPVLRQIVKEKNIPNVHFLEPSAKEKDIWAFHSALDAMAHFRKDGETFGLNIVEAMFCGKPVVSHKSKQWNAHLEYLKPEFSRVAEVGDVKGYLLGMQYFLSQKNTAAYQASSRAARQKAEEVSDIHRHIGEFENILLQSIKN